MFGKDKLAAFSRTLEVNVTQMLERDAKAALVRTAEQERDRVLREQGQRASAIPTYRQIVDGKEGAPLTTVRADGVIVFHWQYLQEVVLETYRMLVERSPRLTGAYIEGLKIFIDEREARLDDIGPGVDFVEIVATVPYARMLEIGRRGGGPDGGYAPFVKQVKPHIVEEIAMVASRMFGNLARIQFSYVDLTVGGDMAPASRRESRERSRGERIRHPAIWFRAHQL